MFVIEAHVKRTCDVQFNLHQKVDSAQELTDRFVDLLCTNFQVF